MCVTAGQYDPNDLNKPLHKCDIDGSLAAGNKISAGLKMGLSRHWSEALELMSGSSELKADAILAYFEPLRVYLRQQNDEWSKCFFFH